MANGIVNVEVVDPTIEMQVLTPIAYQSGGIIPSGVKTITSAGDTDVTSYETARVAAGSVSSPTATKGSVSNHSISVTPGVSYSTGYITGGSKNGTAVSVSASELVSGSRSITSNGNNIDVTNYKYVNVSVSGGGGITPTGTINITNAGDTDVTTYATAHVDGGSVSSPTASKGSVSNHSVTVTPSVSYSEGYIEDGSKTGTGVSVSASELVSGTRSITGNGTGIDVTNYKYVDVNVSGGGGITPTGTINITSSGTTRVYEYEYASVAAGTAGTPTATKGSVSNHSVTVTPSVTSTSGFIQGGTVSGAGATVSASELVSGTRSITSNGSGIDVTNYKYVDVAVPGGAGAPTILTGTDGATTSGTSETNGPSITGMQPGVYNIYASFSAINSSLNSRSVTFKVYVDDSSPSGFSSTQTLSSASPITYTLEKTNVSVTSSLKMTVRAGNSTVHAAAISLIAVKVG